MAHQKWRSRTVVKSSNSRDVIGHPERTHSREIRDSPWVNQMRIDAWRRDGRIGAVGHQVGLYVARPAPSTATPSTNFIPARTSGNRWAPSRRRQRCWVMSSSSNAISSPLVREPAPLVARSRSRTVANGDSITLVVRRCFQCARPTVWEPEVPLSVFLRDAAGGRVGPSCSESTACCGPGSLHVRTTSNLSENRSKSARVRAPCEHGWTRRAAPAALIGGTRITS